MAYDEQLADRIWIAMEGVPNVAEKKMMGGLTFMVNDKMCVGIIKDELMVRIDPDMQETALRQEGCRMMDFTGRPMKGYMMVSPEGIKTKKQLDYWVQMALAFNDKAKSSKKKK